MSRPLSAEMDWIALSSELRQPAYQLQIFDIRTGLNTIADIVNGVTLDPTTGPRNFTAECFELTITEKAGDYISTGINASEIQFSLVDPDDQFDPVNLLDDPTGDGRWLREGNVVRLLEGDARVDVLEWELTFTGRILGQAGKDRNREDRSAFLNCKAVGREAPFVKAINTSDSFPNGSTYLFMAQDVAEDVENGLGLTTGEIDFSGFGNTITTQTTTQFVEQPAITTIAQLMFLDGAMPRFNGAGILKASNGLVSQTPARAYNDLSNIVSLIRPFSDKIPVNSVCIVGLNGVMEKITSERQNLGDLTITTGYFTRNERVERFFSEDKTVMADNVQVEILRSVNGGIFALFPKGAGGGESIELIPAPLPATSGSVGVIMTISTGFAPYLAIALAVAYVAASWLPDIVVSEGFIVTIGETIPIGRAVQALLMVQILMIMAMIGRGEYAFNGEPFEYVFKEIRACAEVDGLTSETRVQVEVKNHLVNSQVAGDNIAREMLFRQQAKGNSRDVTLMADLGIEPDDVFEIPDRGGRRFLIGTITRAYSKREERSGATQAMECFEVTEGVVP